MSEQETPRLTLDDLQTLRAEFPAEKIRIRMHSLNRSRDHALLVPSLKLSDVQERLEQVDPAWHITITGEEPRTMGSVIVRVRLTLRGVGRESCGEGSDSLAAYSDAFKRAANLFGVGRSLNDLPAAWVAYDEKHDKGRHWTWEDYQASAEAGKVGSTKPEAEPEAQAPSQTGLRTTSRPAAHSRRLRDELNRRLMALHRPFMNRFPDTRFPDLLNQRYGVDETRLLATDQLEDLLSFLEEKLSSAA
jgi:hypothetical protein